MKLIDRLLIAIGCGLFVGGWATRHADIAITGAFILCGYGIVRLIAGEWPNE